MVTAPEERDNEAVAALLDAAARRHEENRERYAAFMAEHGSRDISGLSREEARELFSILLAATGLDAEMRVLRKLNARLSP